MQTPVRTVSRRQAASLSREEAVRRAEAYWQASIDAPMPVSVLCRRVGLSERALRDAFYSVRGMGPKRWLVTVRLQGVRNALTGTCAEPTTVTDAAADYGFYELGRFAAIYREAFGETPSDTLRSTNRKVVPTAQGTRTRQCFRPYAR
jgi:transcriptional regulator GlxA family with amidase domain